MAKLRRVSVSSGFGAVVVVTVGLALAQTRAPVHPAGGGAAPAHTSIPVPAPAPASTNLIAVAPAAKPAKPPLVRTMSGSSYTTLSPETKTGIVNGARAKFGMGPLSEAAVVALAGGVLVTPSAPVSGKTVLSFRWEPFRAAGYTELHGASYVFSPVPDNYDDTSSDRVVNVDLETVASRLYIAECAFASAQPLTVTFFVQNGHDAPTFEGPATAAIDPKSGRALFAFRPKSVASRLHVFAYRSPGASAPMGAAVNAMSFTGCSVTPAQ